jgi:hypothetical protein
VPVALASRSEHASEARRKLEAAKADIVCKYSAAAAAAGAAAEARVCAAQQESEQARLEAQAAARAAERLLHLERAAATEQVATRMHPLPCALPASTAMLECTTLCARGAVVGRTFLQVNAWRQEASILWLLNDKLAALIDGIEHGVYPVVQHGLSAALQLPARAKASIRVDAAVLPRLAKALPLLDSYLAVTGRVDSLAVWVHSGVRLPENTELPGVGGALDELESYPDITSDKSFAKCQGTVASDDASPALHAPPKWVGGLSGTATATAIARQELGVAQTKIASLEQELERVAMKARVDAERELEREISTKPTVSVLHALRQCGSKQWSTSHNVPMVNSICTCMRIPSRCIPLCPGECSGLKLGGPGSCVSDCSWRMQAQHICRLEADVKRCRQQAAADAQHRVNVTAALHAVQRLHLKHPHSTRVASLAQATPRGKRLPGETIMARRAHSAPLKRPPKWHPSSSAMLDSVHNAGCV